MNLTPTTKFHNKNHHQIFKLKICYIKYKNLHVNFLYAQKLREKNERKLK